jgi:hypothetical protein
LTTAPAALQQGPYLDGLDRHAFEMSLESGLEVHWHSGRPRVLQQQAYVEKIGRRIKRRTGCTVLRITGVVPILLMLGKLHEISFPQGAFTVKDRFGLNSKRESLNPAFGS